MVLCHHNRKVAKMPVLCGAIYIPVWEFRGAESPRVEGEADRCYRGKWSREEKRHDSVSRCYHKISVGSWQMIQIYCSPFCKLASSRTRCSLDKGPHSSSHMADLILQKIGKTVMEHWPCLWELDSQGLPKTLSPNSNYWEIWFQQMNLKGTKARYNPRSSCNTEVRANTTLAL